MFMRAKVFTLTITCCSGVVHGVSEIAYQALHGTVLGTARADLLHPVFACARIDYKTSTHA